MKLLLEFILNLKKRKKKLINGWIYDFCGGEGGRRNWKKKKRGVNNGLLFFKVHDKSKYESQWQYDKYIINSLTELGIKSEKQGWLCFDQNIKLK